MPGSRKKLVLQDISASTSPSSSNSPCSIDSAEASEMKKISLTPSVLHDSDSLQPRFDGPMLPSEVMHRQKEDRKRSREEIGALEDGKIIPIRLSHPQTVVQMAGQQNYATSRIRTTTVEPDQLMRRSLKSVGTQFFRLYSRNLLMRIFIVQYAKDADSAISHFDRSCTRDDPTARGQLLYRM